MSLNKKHHIAASVVIGVAENTFIVSCRRGDREKLMMLNDAGRHLTLSKVARVNDFAPDSSGCVLVFENDIVGLKCLRLFDFNQPTDRELVHGARLDNWVCLKFAHGT